MQDSDLASLALTTEAQLPPRLINNENEGLVAADHLRSFSEDLGSAFHAEDGDHKTCVVLRVLSRSSDNRCSMPSIMDAFALLQSQLADPEAPLRKGKVGKRSICL